MKQMRDQLYYNTLSSYLHETLVKLMEADELKMFRLVGGTSLSLQLGHRKSIDIDLFSDIEYGTIDFQGIDLHLRQNFKYVDTLNIEPIGFGKSYFIGESAQQCVKLDLFYTDQFIRPILLTDSIRLASLEEIAAMKVDVISRGGRKKDFWDIHELMELYTIRYMIELHKERYPYSHDSNQILKSFTQFEGADMDFDPLCLKHKYWELIKLDILEKLNEI